MSSRRVELRPAGTWKGKGQIFRGEEFVAEAAYLLVRHQQIHHHRSGGIGQGPKDVEGIAHTAGEIEAPQAARLIGEKLTLRLKDGSRIDFIPHRKITEDYVSVMVSGDFYKPES